MKPISLFRSILTVGIWTFASRLLGLLREVVLFAMIGPGPVLDAFLAAFRLPNMFRRFFAEGAFNAAFVPMFSKRIEAGEDADGFAREAAGGLALILLLLCALAMIFMPLLVRATADGFTGTERFDLAVGYGRIMFPYILFISLAALYSGALNSAGHFAAAAAAPVLLNVMIVAAMTAAWALGGAAITWLVWTVPLAGIAQLGLVFAAARRAGMRIWPGRPRWSPRMKALALVALPAMLSGGVLQINLLIGQQVASHYDKAVSWLYGADRLYQLPLGMVGIAVGVVLLPDLSRRLKAGDEAGSRAALSRASEISAALAMPAAVALVAIPAPLIAALYEHGQTGPADTAAMASALMIYGLGLPAFMAQKLLQPLFFARQDTRRPFRYALVAMLVNAAVAIGLSPMIGWIACAWATTAAAWVMLALLLGGARTMGAAARLAPGTLPRLARIALASLLMGGIVWGAAAALAPMAQSGALRLTMVLGLVLLGAASYGALGQALGAFRLRDFRAALRR